MKEELRWKTRNEALEAETSGMRMWILWREATEKWTLTDTRRTSEYRKRFIINPRR